MSHLEDHLLLQIQHARLPIPERERVFAPPRRWRFDLAWPDALVAVEVEGGVWQAGGGRHTRGAGFEADCCKYFEAALLGWLVIRCSGKMVEDGRALAMVRRALMAR